MFEYSFHLHFDSQVQFLEQNQIQFFFFLSKVKDLINETDLKQDFNFEQNCNIDLDQYLSMLKNLYHDVMNQ